MSRNDATTEDWFDIVNDLVKELRVRDSDRFRRVDELLKKICQNPASAEWMPEAYALLKAESANDLIRTLDEMVGDHFDI